MMKVDVYEIKGSGINCDGTPYVLVPENKNPQSLDIFKAKNVTFKKCKTIDLNSDDKRIALDSQKAFSEIESQGYHLTGAKATVVEIQ
jgi:hypothetical protein